MKGIKKLLLVSLAFAGLFSCESTGGNGKGSSSVENPEKASVIKHIKKNAISSEDGMYIVDTTTTTDTSTFLIYDDGEDAFGLGAYSEYQALVSIFTIKFAFMDLANAVGIYTIENNSVDVFVASIDGVVVSEHKASDYSFTITKGSDNINEAGVNLMTAMFSLALSDCGKYISANDLPYIY